MRHLVSRHKSLPTWAALLLTAGGAALCAWGLTHEFSTDAAEHVRRYTAILGFGLAVGIPVQWSVAGRWFELVGDELRMYRGQTLRRAWHVSQVARIQPFGNMYFVVFSDGAWVWVDHTAAGGARLLDELRDAVRHRSGQSAVVTVDGGRVLLPVSYLTFPSHCVRCHGEAASTWNLVASRGFAFGHVHSFLARVAISVPVCAACRRRRRLAGFAAHLAPVIGVFAIAWTMGSHHPQLASFFVAAFLLTCANVYFFPYAIRRAVDQQILGVSAHGLSEDHGCATLCFRDPLLGLEVARLTAAAERKRAESESGP